MEILQLSELLQGEIATITITPDGQQLANNPPEGAILSGSFNPLHAGHEGMASAASEFTGLPVAFELPIINADKGAMAEDEVLSRAEQFAGRYTLILSTIPLFVDKADLYPGRSFVLGYDTAARLLDARYYGGQNGRDAALAKMAAAGCRFVVAGRSMRGHFYTLDDLDLPDAFADLAVAIPEALFRADISSTEIRASNS